MSCTGYWIIGDRIGEFHYFRDNESNSLCKDHLPLRLALGHNRVLSPNLRLSECFECVDMKNRIETMEELSE